MKEPLRIPRSIGEEEGQDPESVCVHLRKLNARTVKDSYPIPRISETLQALSGAEWFAH